jgi:hypothetical protein
MRKMRLLAFGLGGAIAIAATAIAVAAPGAETGPSSSQSPYLLRSQPGIVTESILTTGDSVNNTPDGSPYRMVGIPDGLGAFDNGDGTLYLVDEPRALKLSGRGPRPRRQGRLRLPLDDPQGRPRGPPRRGSDQDAERLGSDPERRRRRLEGRQHGRRAGRLNRLCSADLAPISAFFHPATGNGYDGRIFADGEEGGTQGRPFGHVVDTGQSYELTPWIGNMSFENVVAHPNTGSDATVVMALDDGDATVGQQVYLYRGTKTNAGNPVQRAGLANGKLYGVKVLGIPQSEFQKTDWQVGDEFDFELADVSQFAGVGGTTNDGTVNTLDEDSQAKGVTSFQRPEDGSWDPRNSSDFYFVTTSSFGPLPAESRIGETRLWRLRFADPTDPSQGGKLTLLVSGPVGTADSPAASGTQSAGSPGPQMLDNITVNNRGQVIMLEDVGNQAYRGGVWVYDIATANLSEIAEHDPDRFTPGASGFLTKDEEASGVIPAPFLGADAYLLDVQAHESSTDTELVQGGQLLELEIPPGKPLK